VNALAFVPFLRLGAEGVEVDTDADPADRADLALHHHNFPPVDRSELHSDGVARPEIDSQAEGDGVCIARPALVGRTGKGSAGFADARAKPKRSNVELNRPHTDSSEGFADTADVALTVAHRHPRVV
jgi:hypothetical protein